MKNIFNLFLFCFTLSSFAADTNKTNSKKNISVERNILAALFKERAQNGTLPEITPQLKWRKTYLFQTGNAKKLYTLANDIAQKFQDNCPKDQAYPISTLKYFSAYKSAYGRVNKKSLEDTKMYESFLRDYKSMNVSSIGCQNGPQFALFFNHESFDPAYLFFSLDGNTPKRLRKIHNSYIENSIIGVLRNEAVWLPKE
jgi:hypothetical protein